MQWPVSLTVLLMINQTSRNTQHTEFSYKILRNIFTVKTHPKRSKTKDDYQEVEKITEEHVGINISSDSDTRLK